MHVLHRRSIAKPWIIAGTTGWVDNQISKFDSSVDNFVAFDEKSHVHSIISNDDNSFELFHSYQQDRKVTNQIIRQQSDPMVAGQKQTDVATGP